MPLVNAGLVQAILTAHNVKSASLGKYPPPTPETVLAAEILKRVLTGAYDGKFAVASTGRKRPLAGRDIQPRWYRS